MAWCLGDWSARTPTEGSPLFAAGAPLPEEEARTIWQELALGHWEVVEAMDVDGRRHLAIVPKAQPEGSGVNWRMLRSRERLVVALVARGCPQKVIALKLGIAPSTVSAAFQAARVRLGFASANELVRAWQVSGERG